MGSKLKLDRTPGRLGKEDGMVRKNFLRIVTLKKKQMSEVASGDVCRINEDFLSFHFVRQEKV